MAPDTRQLELLAPARDTSIARQAIMHGADAVYIGGPSHGARAAAGNDIDDIASLVRTAHLYGVKVYVTLNTIVYEPELKNVEQLVHSLYEAGVDALIVQDMSLLRMHLPPIDLHASTQCDIRTPEKAKFLADCGFSQLVLPREMSIDQIRAVRAAVPPHVKLEAFVHGALCVSYSGDCQASCAANGRSANRGECAQMCRMAYTLTDGDGREVLRDKYLLSLRDLNRLQDIGALVDAGIDSLKIEGRLKDSSYVRTTVAAYRRALDAEISRSGDRYSRASYGHTDLRFEPVVDNVFNRGFTRYFTDGRPAAATSMACIGTPKWIGREVGTVVHTGARYITASLTESLNNGDGLGYFDTQGRYTGFRLNRIDGQPSQQGISVPVDSVDGQCLYPATKVDIPAGTRLYRNRDTRLDAVMAQDTATRRIGLTMTLSHDDGQLRLDIESESGVCVSAQAPASIDTARSPQRRARHDILDRLGNTPYRLDGLDDRLDDSMFVAASVLTRLRQQAVESLTEAIEDAYVRRERLPEDRSAQLPQTVLTYHDNVANSLAREFYRSHGATDIQPALETLPEADRRGQVVMTTRYCLRRELGACMLTPEGKRLKGPLTIANAATSYRLDFDCKNCCMKVINNK